MRGNSSARAARGVRSAFPRHLLARVADTVGSVWFGVTIMALILVYSWIGSAGTAPFSEWFVRQSFEKTEMEWFSWWPFNLLLALLSLSLVLVTVRKIPLTLPNAGVWVVHSGILVLTLGAAVYFGLKLEGDMAVYRREAVLSAGSGPPVRLTLQSGAQAFVPSPSGGYRVQVADLNPAYELLTGEDKGRKTYSAQLRIQPADNRPPFVRQLLVGYPQYTEDALPGQGRAIKVLGRKLVDETLDVRLDYAGTDRVFLNDRPALLARASGAAEWAEMPLAGLPRYHERVLDAADVLAAPGEEGLRVRPLDLHPRWSSAHGAPPDGVQLRVTGFVPYARVVQGWEPVENGGRPYIRFVARAGHNDPGEAHVLVDGEPGAEEASIAGVVDASFRWIENPAELQELLNPGAPVLRVRVGATEQEIPLAQLMGQKVAVRGTPYTILGVQFHPTWSGNEATGHTHGSMLLVQVRAQGRTFLRQVVYPQDELSRDLDDAGRPLPRPETALSTELAHVVRAGLQLVAGPVGAHALLVSQGGQVLHRELVPDQPVDFLDGALSLTLWDSGPHAARVEKPQVVPAAERDPKAGPAYSMIQVRVEQGGGSQDVWLEYSHYAHPSRAGYFPARVMLADGRTLELLYSRESRRLPAPVALEEFALETYPGRNKERDYISRVRFFENGRWSDIHEVHSNNPTAHAGWWYFQSTWDPPQPEANYAGMNYTGLGVGNRHGVGIMLLGAVMTVLGTLWAFYVKPVILRRRVLAGATAARPALAPAVPGAPNPNLEPAASGGGHAGA
ncbi:MAG: hypothetical protein KBD01_08725 [Acidobacteria bacterium]|nr:hypothetical protein [Acidobacteriota bacterium]